jgi:tRNA (adenine57-N1/adenine58-N1)-methyltransferase
LSLVQAHDPVLLISEEGKRYLVFVEPGGSWYTNRGRLPYEEIIGQPYGQVKTTHLGQKFLILRPTTSDLIQYLKRTTQIVYPKDAARLVMELDLQDGKRMIEAGTGSGGLTLAFARAVAPSGHVYSYEIRPEHQRVAQRNLEKLNLLPYVDLKLRDAAEGFDEQDVDAVFLDARDAAAIIPQAEAALTESGIFAALQPTVNQVSDVLRALEDGNFVDIRVEEILIRPWKPVPDRLRPADRMIAHTGYLIFARKLDARYRVFWMDKRARRRAAEFGKSKNISPMEGKG